MGQRSAQTDERSEAAGGTEALAGSRTATVTMLFTDIEGSTRRWEESPQMFDLVEQHFRALRTSVGAAGGTIFATMGDGVAAAFGSADAAVRAGLAAQRQLRALGIGVRMAVHTGEVERAGDDFRGRSVNRAARIMAVARGGQIVVSDVTASLLRSGSTPCPLELADAGTHQLRDLTEPERLWHVVHPDLAAAPPPPVATHGDVTGLPRHRTSLVGREDDAAAVASLLVHERIVTLTGVGGVGKTRLAVHVANHLPQLVGREATERVGRVRFVPLACLTDPDDVLGAIANAVGAAPATDALDGLTGVLGDGAVLLVVDNCEHLVDGAAAAIDALTARCPGVRVLVTSREALGIEGEHVVAVRPLDPSTGGVELFRQRAVAAGADLDDVARSSVERLCARLDGLPLAIELAAARAATLGVSEILAALDGRSAVLEGGRRRVEERHTTLRATIEWSSRLLEPDERRLFSWLAVFVDGFELDAPRHVAEALGIDPPSATAYVASLTAKSMISVDAGPAGARYRMLETMRAFAFELLDARDERTAALTALARWMTTIAGLPADAPCTAEVERCSVRLEREAGNWREAIELAGRLRSGEQAAGLCGPPANFFLIGRHDLAELLRPLLDVCDEPWQRRAVLCALIVSASGTTPPDQHWAWANEVQAIDDADPDGPTGLGGLMRWLALAWRGDFEASIRVCVEASLDERIHQSARDLFVGIAILDHFSLTDATDDRYGLVATALEVAERTEMALARITCLLGVAWAVGDRDPARSIEVVRRALDDIADVPPLTRLTLPGDASRLLSRLDPVVAAQALLQQLDGDHDRESFVDLVPLFYGAALLEQLGNPAAAPTMATVTTRPLEQPASMMDFVDRARRASGWRDRAAIAELEEAVRRGLAEVANV